MRAAVSGRSLSERKIATYLQGIGDKMKDLSRQQRYERIGLLIPWHLGA